MTDQKDVSDQTIGFVSTSRGEDCEAFLGWQVISDQTIVALYTHEDPTEVIIDLTSTDSWYIVFDESVFEGTSVESQGYNPIKYDLILNP